MTSSTYQAGDVVKLRSGGPPMTIKSLEMLDNPNGRQQSGEFLPTGVRCIWHDEGGKLQEEVFPQHVLETRGASRWQTQNIGTGSGYQQGGYQQRYNQGDERQQAIEQASHIR